MIVPLVFADRVAQLLAAGSRARSRLRVPDLAGASAGAVWMGLAFRAL